ncbi:MAG: hypothetical protein M1587_06950 [Thaumarchaeota archaeon]|nr:hypothetical protein [Nitrososphaerota archaeon]
MATVFEWLQFRAATGLSIRSHEITLIATQCTELLTKAFRASYFNWHDIETGKTSKHAYSRSTNDIR